jgi:hypothetical protein
MLQEFFVQTESSLMRDLPNDESWLPSVATESKVFLEISGIT